MCREQSHTGRRVRGKEDEQMTHRTETKQRNAHPLAQGLSKTPGRFRSRSITTAHTVIPTVLTTVHKQFSPIHKQFRPAASPFLITILISFPSTRYTSLFMSTSLSSPRHRPCPLDLRRLLHPPNLHFTSPSTTHESHLTSILRGRLIRSKIPPCHSQR